jgi:hypothetical protein
MHLGKCISKIELLILFGKKFFNRLKCSASLKRLGLGVLAKQSYTGGPRYMRSFYLVFRVCAIENSLF